MTRRSTPDDIGGMRYGSPPTAGAARHASAGYAARSARWLRCAAVGLAAANSHLGLSPRCRRRTAASRRV
eukprot:7383549-Prymnesium_polylepis.1